MVAATDVGALIVAGILRNAISDLLDRSAMFGLTAFIVGWPAASTYGISLATASLAGCRAALALSVGSAVIRYLADSHWGTCSSPDCARPWARLRPAYPVLVSGSAAND